MDPCNRSMSTVGFQDKHARTPLLPTRGPIDPTIFTGTSIGSTCLLASLDIIWHNYGSWRSEGRDMTCGKLIMWLYWSFHHSTIKSGFVPNWMIKTIVHLLVVRTHLSHPWVRLRQIGSVNMKTHSGHRRYFFGIDAVNGFVNKVGPLESTNLYPLLKGFHTRQADGWPSMTELQRTCWFQACRWRKGFQSPPATCYGSYNGDDCVHRHFLENIVYAILLQTQI